MTGTPSECSRLPDPGAGFVWEDFEGALVLRPYGSRARAAFTTRVGGGSTGPFEAWNVSFAVGDDHECVRANRELANRSIGRPGAPSWGRIRQVHGNRVVRAADDGALRTADGVWTDDPADVIAVNGGDCATMLLEGEDRIAAAHGGWRGLVAGIVEAAAEATGASRVWIGPAIGPCCFEIKQDAAAPLRDRFGPAVMADDQHADLWAAAEMAARSAGVADIHVARLCTSCHDRLFFSHRRDRGRTGRQALVATIDR